MSLSKNVSLCLVVANSDDCLNRFFEWSLSKFEDIIVVKSDSKDSTDQILDKFVTKYPNQISLYYKPIVNIADQKQYCVNLSKKKYKLIIDADEIMEDCDWDSMINWMDSNAVDLVYFPRYNLQKDENHYLSTSYPDWQPRLFNSLVKFDTNPMYETHHVMTGQRQQSAIPNCHIIHWGHIRNQDQLKWKSDMRKKYAKTDLCDGENLLNYDNWFFERNKVMKFDEQAIELPETTKKLIMEYNK